MPAGLEDAGLGGLVGRDKKGLDQGLTFGLGGADGVEVVRGVDVVAVRAALEAVR